jgi:hypothetical protein
MGKPILCLDFDGVIHTCECGWCGGAIYGGVTEGFWEWAEEAARHFRLVIHSSRAGSEEGRAAMRLWLAEQRRLWREAQGRSGADALNFEFARDKPPAFVTLDDRALTFTGRWEEFEPERLRRFRPWTQRRDGTASG